MSFTQGHALIIGVGSYCNAPHWNVPITVADAKAVAATLCNPQFCGYPTAQVTLLTDHHATRDGILTALATLAQRTTPDDTVVLFYAGHGMYGSDGAYYLTAHDTVPATQSRIADCAIGQTDLITALRAIPAQRLLVLINACHAGELSPTLNAPPSAEVTGQPFPSLAAAGLLHTGSERIIITACREGQVAYIGRGQVTIFAQALIDGLRGQGVADHAGYIGVFDLYTHLYAAVRAAVEQQVPLELRRRHSLTQEPELTVLKGVGSFAVALAPPATAVRMVEPAPGSWAHGAGEQSVAIAGSVNASTIITGDSNTVVRGDIICTGNISGSGIAIGRGVQATVSLGHAPSPPIVSPFTPIYTAIRLRPPDATVAPAALTAIVQAIEQEVQQGAQPDAQRLRNHLRALIALAPDLFAMTGAVLDALPGDPGIITRTVVGQVRRMFAEERDDG
ncbi:MAG: caspase family protein [Roseiflexus sp.]